MKELLWVGAFVAIPYVVLAGWLWWEVRQAPMRQDLRSSMDEPDPRKFPPSEDKRTWGPKDDPGFGY